MKSVVTRTVATLATILSLGAVPALAQYNAPPPYGAMPPSYGAVLPPFEVVTIIRSMGFEPLGRPVLRGPVYAIQALDDASIPVRVLVDARSGNVVRVSESRPQSAYMGVAPDAGFGPRRSPPETVPPGAVYRPYEDDLAPPAIQAPPPKPKVAARTPLPRPAPPQSRAAVTPPPVSGTAVVIPDPTKTPGKSIPAPVANKSATAGDVSVTGSIGPAAPEAKPTTPDANAKTPDPKPIVVPPVAPLE